MIPHHAGATLVCEESPIQVPEIRALPNNRLGVKQAEIDQMKAKLRELQD